MGFRLEKDVLQVFLNILFSLLCGLEKAYVMQGKVLIISFESPWKFSILILSMLLVQSLLSEFYLLWVNL